MEILFEFLIELIFEATLETSKNRKVPKIVRYPLIFLIILFFIATIGLIIFTGTIILNKNILVGIFFIIIGIVMAVISIKKFRDTYLNISDNKKN